MNKTINIIIITGFLIVDFLLLHDIFKAGETHSATEYLVVVLSIIVFYNSVNSLIKIK